MINNNTLGLKSNTFYFWLIGILSVVVPVVVAILFYLPKSDGFAGMDFTFLPFLNAILNSATAICLVAGFVFIKKGYQKYHITSMISAFSLSSIFLVSYLIYHFTSSHTKYGDIDHNGVVDAIEIAKAGTFRYVYLFVVLTHIVLATAIVPLVLFSIYFGISKQYQKHKKIVKWTFPLWLYVAITGVLVYLMISPYYPGK